MIKVRDEKDQANPLAQLDFDVRRDLALLRQWSDPADAETWLQERVMTSSAYLARENRSPQELWVWGAPTWPTGSLPHHLLQPEIPGSEVL